MRVFFFFEKDVMKVLVEVEEVILNYRKHISLQFLTSAAHSQTKRGGSIF